MRSHDLECVHPLAPPPHLRATSPGKLLNYVVEDGGHVGAGQHYAEIEVMKMVTHLSATVSGTYVAAQALPHNPPTQSHTHSIHHVRRPGAILHPGTLVATLDLDDPSQVQAAKRYTDTLPQLNKTSGCGEKVHQVRVSVGV